MLMTEDGARDAERNMEDFKAAGGNASSIDITTDPAEAEEVRLWRYLS